MKVQCTLMTLATVSIHPTSLAPLNSCNQCGGIESKVIKQEMAAQKKAVNGCIGCMKEVDSRALPFSLATLIEQQELEEVTKWTTFSLLVNVFCHGML